MPEGTSQVKIFDMDVAWRRALRMPWITILVIFRNNELFLEHLEVGWLFW